jgi:SAM-dependent methyltransferase
MRRISFSRRGVLTPARRRGIEILDDLSYDARTVRRSMRDVALANRLFGGTRAVLAEFADALDSVKRHAVTLVDVGTGAGDIPGAARGVAARRGITLRTIGVDGSESLARAASSPELATVRADAFRLPFRDRSADVVLCSQLLHHFEPADAVALLRELDRVARVRVIVSDLRRSWLAAAGIWLASFPLRFHPVSRHDGVVSVLRGFTRRELALLVHSAVGGAPTVHNRFGFRVTASWRPGE